MKKYFLFLLFPLVLSCAAGMSSAVKPEGPLYRPAALNHVVNGTVMELLDMQKEALFYYHQAAEIDSSSPSIYLAIADNYYNLKNPEAAASSARKALKLDPNNLEALYLLGLCYESLQKYDEALKVYQQIVKLRPDDQEALYYLASLEVMTGKPKKAFATYQRLRRTGFEDPQYLMELAGRFVENRCFRQAEQVYIDVQRLYPHLESIYLGLAGIAKMEGDTTRALLWYQKALEFNPSFEDVKAELISIYENRKDLTSAVKLFERLSAVDSGDVRNKLQLGQYYLMAKDTTAALQLYEAAAKQHPESENAYLTLALLHLSRKDSAAAESVCRSALAQNADFHRLRLVLRDIYADQKRWDEAIALFLPMKEVDSTAVVAGIEIGKLMMQKGDTLQALSLVESLTAAYPEDWRAPAALARFFQGMNKPAKALEWFNRAAKLQQKIPEIYVLRALNYADLDSLERAEAILDSAAAVFPKDPAVQYYLGYIANRRGNPSRAVRFYLKSLELDPRNDQTALSLAAAYDELGQYDRAEELYKKLLHNNPDSPIVLNNYAYHLSVQARDLERALAMAERAVAAVPKSAPYLDTLGWIYYQMGDYEKARSYIEASLEIAPDNAEVTEHLGDVMFKLGDNRAAQDLWRRALELDSRRTHILIKLLELETESD
ncbi:MAG: tetratricopeptide repeat protein [candidate division KSB1 bacterium]|nr:tetratricopeptide repeat protein [candidate division KSB1 bacterium]